MIFIINETNEELKLKTTTLEDGATVDLQVGESLEGTIATTKSKDIASAISNRFSEGEVIKNRVSRHNFKLEGSSRMYIDNRSGEGVELVAIDGNDELPPRYTYAKDVIVVVHSGNSIVSMKEDSLNGAVRTVEAEQGDYKITIFVIKWYNWSKLSSPVSVNIDDKAAYQLQAVPSKTIEGRLINAVVKKGASKKDGKPNNRKKYVNKK